MSMTPSSASTTSTTSTTAATSTTTRRTTLRFRPLPAALPDLTALPPETSQRVVADVPNSYPCRRCLRDAAPGDELVLLSYDPFLGTSAYRQPGPIFVHVQDCAPTEQDLVSAPEQLRRRELSLRGFDRGHRQVATALVAGPGVEDAAQRLLDDPEVAYLHVHNAGPGCFAVRIERAS
jgi:hypothetical protein